MNIKTLLLQQYNWDIIIIIVAFMIHGEECINITTPSFVRHVNANFDYSQNCPRLCFFKLVTVIFIS